MRIIQFLFLCFSAIVAFCGILFRSPGEAGLVAALIGLVPETDFTSGAEMQFAAVFLSSAILLLYAALTSLVVSAKFKDYRSNARDAALAEGAFDTIYYLGFVGTLVSMILALTQPPSEAEALRVVSQNAIALGTTVIGIIARTVLCLGLGSEIEGDDETLSNSLRNVAMNAELATARLVELGQNVAGLSSQIGGYADKVRSMQSPSESINRIVAQVLIQTNEAIESRILSDNEKFRKSIKMLAQDSLKAREEIEESVSSISQAVGAISKMIEEERLKVRRARPREDGFGREGARESSKASDFNPGSGSEQGRRKEVWEQIIDTIG